MTERFDEPSGCDWCPTCTSARSDLQATIQRVRELHAPLRVDLAGSERCGYCAMLPWPCDTIRAIEGGAE